MYPPERMRVSDAEREALVARLPLLALVFGVMTLPGIACMPFGMIAGIPGIVLGAISLYKIRAGMPGSRAMALTGLICGSLGILFQIAFFALMVGLPT